MAKTEIKTGRSASFEKQISHILQQKKMRNENKLVKELKRGNELAFRQLVEQHKDMVYHTAWGFIHDQQASEDLAQEVFLEVFNSIGKFRGNSKISTWIYQITVNKSLNEVKKQKRRQSEKRISDFYNPDEKGEIEIAESENKTPAAISENEERKVILKKAIDALPENQRTAFILHKYDGLAYKKIADVMETSLSSVESLIHRAKLNLQKNLTKYYHS